MGDVMKGTLAASGIQLGLSGIVSGFKSVVSGGIEYEQSQNQFQAVTQASADEMAKASELAKQLGSDIKLPGASAQTATAAMLSLAKGGLTASEAMDAARGTMVLAAAAGIDAANAAEVQAGALKTFGLEADQAGRVANVLANVTNKSAGELTDFAQGLSQSGAVAHMMGMSIEDTTTALGLFAAAGLQGSDGGTSLRQSLMMLMNPSKEAQRAIDDLGLSVWDAQGNFVGYRSIVEQLSEAKKNLTQQEFAQASAQIFGSDAVRAASIIADQGTASWDDMGAAIGNVNGATDMAAANSKGLSGVIDALKNTVDTASLSLFETLQPSIMQVAEAATGLVGPLAESLAPALGAVADLATGTLAPALSGLTGFLGAVVGPVSDVVNWFGDLPTPIGTAVLALGGVIAIGGPLNATFTSAKANLVTLLATMRGTAGAATAASGGLAGYIASIRAATGAAATFGVIAKGALSVLGGPIGLAIIGVTTALSLFSSGSDEAATSTEGLSSAIDEQTGKLKGNAAQVIATEAANSGASAAYERLGGNVADYVDALGGIPEAQEKVNAKIAESKAAYDKQQAAIMAATQGTAGFAGATAASAAASENAAPAIGDLNTATDYLSSAQGTLAGKTEDVRLANEGATGALASTAEATGEVGEATNDAEKAATPFADALKEIRSASAEADANAQFLSITLQRMAGNTIPAEQQARANAAAFRAIGQASRDMADANDEVSKKQAEYDQIAAHLGTTLDGQEASATNLVITQADVDRAARDVADAQARAADASDKLKDSQDKAGTSARDMAAAAYSNALANGSTMTQAIQAAVDKIKEQREQFIKAAVDAGLSQQAAEDLANAQSLIPENVRTTYEAQGVQAAIDKAVELNSKLSELDRKEFYYKVVGTEVQKFVTGSYAPEDLHATGGYITGPGTGTSDSIRARLSNGEFVVRASQTAKYRDVLEQINTPGFAQGGLVGNIVKGTYENPDWSAGLGNIVASFDKLMKERLLSAGFSGGLNPSQNPSSFGWQRANGIVPYAWNGHPFVGGVAGGTQGLWAGLMNALVPQIPGGLMAPIWAYENRNNVNSPGNASFHAYGLAADINAPQNPNGAPGDGRSGPGVIPAGVARSLAARFGMEWGGDFRGTPDPMHFEIHVSPGQIGAGGTINLGGGSSGGSGVEQWRSLGLSVLQRVGAYKGMNLTPFIGQMLNQIRTESSGNPNAINTTDINAQRGDPSIGLLQVIGSTFRNALSGTPFAYLIARGQRDPEASMVASTLYSLGRYGSLDKAWRGVAYANGGIVPGLPSQGDSVPALLTPGEGVFTAPQTDAIITHAQALANGFGAQPVVNVTPHIEITNYVDIDGILSRTEVIVDGKFAEAAAQVRTVAARS